MKRSVAVCVLFLFTAPVFCATLAAPPKFAGTWVLNRSKSAGLTGGLADAEVHLVVSQDDRLMAVEQKVIARGRVQPSQEFTYRLDGSETSVDVARPLPGTMRLHAKWNEAGKTLELTATISGEVEEKPVTITTREQWQLLEGGKALRITRTRETPQGKQQSRLYFDRQ